jgi:drug/metabolite transporter (DMT)-like permease
VDAIFLAALAGASFGALTVAVQWGIRRGADLEVGALVAATTGVVTAAIVVAPSVAIEGVDVEALLPFFGAGLIAPGASQIFLTLAVRHAGASRVAILMGAAPLISILIALVLLNETFRPPLVMGTIVIVLGGVALVGERIRPDHSGRRGAVLALLCAALFAARDNLLRWAVRDDDVSPLLAATSTLLAATAFILIYLLLVRRDHLRTRLLPAVPAFVPAGLALALGYGTLLLALDRGSVSIVSPLNATGSLWAVLFAALVIGRSEAINRRTVLAALLVVAGGALIGTFR